MLRGLFILLERGCEVNDRQLRFVHTGFVAYRCVVVPRSTARCGATSQRHVSYGSACGVKEPWGLYRCECQDRPAACIQRGQVQVSRWSHRRAQGTQWSRVTAEGRSEVDWEHAGEAAWRRGREGRTRVEACDASPRQHRTPLAFQQRAAIPRVVCNE